MRSVNGTEWFWLGGSGGTTYTVIQKIDTKDVCHVDDSLVFRIIDLGSGDICLDAIYLFVGPLSSRGIGVSEYKPDKIRMRFTLSCALIANACEGLRY